MKTNTSVSPRGSIIPTTLVASLFVGAVALLGLTTLSPAPVSNMYISQTQEIRTVGETFPVSILIESAIPVNVFSGEVHFNSDVLRVESIEYNTSVANLWAEKPWFDNGAGTLNFAGGTTQTGGFTGDATLVTIIFKAIQDGQGIISLETPRILLHDGLGTDATVPASIDAIITVEERLLQENNIVIQTTPGTNYTVVKEKTSTDLNGDGKQSIADISIFMLNMTSYASTYDFNGDGKVNLTDLNILLGARQSKPDGL